MLDQGLLMSSLMCLIFLISGFVNVCIYTKMYDTDRSGCITKEEVASMLRVSNKIYLFLYNYCNTPSELRLYIIFTRIF